MKALAIAMLRQYKRWISPLLAPSCRYVPTCSEYAMEALDRYGVLRGGMMSVWRLLRCHPFVKGGYDPVVKGSQPRDRQDAACAHHATQQHGAARATNDQRLATSN